ncbi:MAG: hypothetical protein QOE08_2301 [Thermoleophilaceae bacterium]|nr:hypothetical protein [Thermoleophilaceae bacterium]
MSRFLPAALAIAAVLVAAAPAAAAPAPGAYGQNDFGGFNNIAPPGANGRSNAAELGAFEASGQRPPHNSDQLGMYGDLVYATPGLTAPDLRKYFKDATFGVKPDDVERTYSPRPDVTIVRDKGFGVPHIYSESRAGAMWATGYVAGEDRLFFIDVLRHVGRSQLSSFVGGAEGNRSMDEEEWGVAPYTEADLQQQVDQLDNLLGPDGAQVQDDLQNYVDGVNAYIAEARLDPTKMPGEYGAINRPQGPDDWKTTDIIATAALVGGIFGKGGGNELGSALVLQEARKRFGPRRGKSIWADFRSAEDPEAPTTVQKKRFIYEKPPKKARKGSAVLPDSGTLKLEPLRSGSGGGGGGGGGGTCLPGTDVCLPGSAKAKGTSNAIVVSARESKSGHPLAVFGPQTGYFAPQILMEQEIHAPGIDARGASFPGVNLYVQLGRGPDYSWSATSAGQDNTDTFAVDLCEPDGKPATLASSHYMFRGQCLPFEPIVRNNSWTPSAADQTPPGSETLTALRTKLGIVAARSTVKGKPVAFTRLRSTYMHEVDSAPGFADFNNPDKMGGPAAFQRAASKIGYTFNWLYTDDHNISYFNSGANPVRAAGTDPNFPVAAKYEWRGFDPANVTERVTPFAQHPHVTNQAFLDSWNNKQAPGYRAADNNFGFSSVYRVKLLNDRVKRAIRGKRKTTLLELINAMEDAGSVDLRGDSVLPWALKVIGKPSDPQTRSAVATLTAWVKAGAHRRDRDHSGTYDNAEAVRIMDAWWPKLVEAEFEPTLGSTLFKQIASVLPIDNEPNNHGAHLGSAYQDGWYGYARKDLRTILKRKVRGRYSRVYCGGGRLSKCRSRLRASLKAAAAVPASELYGKDTVCNGNLGKGLDKQLCFDAIMQRALGAVTQPLIHWINRPTFQQANEIQRHRPR